MDNATGFQPCQILCQEYERSYLYAEAIQAAAERPLYWVRPLLLATVLSQYSSVVWDFSAPSDEVIVYDLRQASDLLWPIQFFRSALDTELLPLLEHLSSKEQMPEGDRLAHQQFRAFIHRVWCAHPDVFKALS